MKKCFRAAAALLLLCLALISCRGKDDKSIVARVGKTVLTLQEVRERTPGVDAPAARDQAERYIQHWIESELLYQEALRRGVDKESEVRRALREMTRDYITTALVEQLAVGITASDAEIERYYQEQKEEFQAEEDLYHPLLILVRTADEAGTARRELNDGTSFAEVVRRYSIDGSRFQGGDLGYVPLRALSPLLSRAVSAMRPGEISAPLKSEVGYNLIRLEGVQKKGSMQPLDEVRPQVIERVLAQKKEKAYQQLITQLSGELVPYADMTLLESIKKKE
ncbi:MAG TPA: peptidyl-prolyl cis-trans isomerase [bacterium]|nr:peptidyl-prolyl cis-trans isomerase [bacterium]HPR86493.1 peptidyl-prolyl cis-trans isomerase [bacterium]